MSDNIKASLDALAPLSSKLDDQDTAILNLIADIEEVLRLHVNVRISLDIGDDRTLAFCRHKKEWQLIVERGHAESTPLRSNPRWLRADVFTSGHVDALIRGAVDQIGDKVATSAKALREAERLLTMLVDTIPLKP